MKNWTVKAVEQWCYPNRKPSPKNTCEVEIHFAGFTYDKVIAEMESRKASTKRGKIVSYELPTPVMRG